MSIISKIAAKIVGSRNQRLVKKLAKVVAEINAFEPTLKALSDADLSAKTAEFKKRLEQKTTLDELLPEAFAVMREGFLAQVDEKIHEIAALNYLAADAHLPPCPTDTNRHKNRHHYWLWQLARRRDF